MDIVQDPEGAGPLDGSSLSKGALECSCDAAVPASPQPPMWLSRRHTHAAAMPLEKPSAGGAAPAPACAPVGALAPAPPRGTNSPSGGNRAPAEPTSMSAPPSGVPSVRAQASAPLQGTALSSGGNQAPAEPPSGAGSRAVGRRPSQRKGKATPGPRTTLGEMHQRPDEVLFASHNANGLKEG